ncbi:GNAT family N-acetyltransferase [Streptomyces sp. URMC 123]|uniref:GNAT family N-acetyltransferase n=1 Tax=Streptomyces sp. URMC 123 TaxID=3423403 RepID=UPI003F1CCD74
MHGGLATASILIPLRRGSGEPALITELVVRPAERGKGLGTEILNLVCAEAEAEGMDLMLSVDPSPGGLTFEELVQWYERHGFVEHIEEGEPQPGIMIRRFTPR